MTAVAPPPTAPADPLIGRHAELEILVERLKGARAGRAGLVVVRGDAGVGKSRLLSEAMTAASRLGFRVLHGRADQLDRGLPYAALRDALATPLDQESNEALAPIASRLRSAIATGGVEAGDELTPGPGPGPGNDVFAACEQLVRAWADREPVLLVVDDLHAADPDTVTMLTVLARTLKGTRVLIATAVRAHPPELDGELAAHLDRLALRGDVTVVDLAALDADDVLALITTRLDARPDDDLLSTVFDLTRGNPFYAEELLRAYASGGVIEVANGRARMGTTAERVSLTTSGALLHRVFSLGPEVRAVVRAFTAFQRLSLDRLNLVADVTNLDPGAVDTAFDTLVSARILDARPDGGWEFAHPIVRTTLYDDLGPAERRRLHRAIADALLTDEQAGRPVDPIELAVHVSHAVEPGDPRAAAVLARAGDLTAPSAPRSAADWYRRALETLPGDDPHRGPWLAKRARSLFLAQRKAEAAIDARAALSLLEPGRERERAAVVLAGCLSALGRSDEALAVTDAELPAGDRPRLLAERASLLVQLDRFPEAEEAAARAEACATDPAGHALAVAATAQAMFGRGAARPAIQMLTDELGSLDDPGAASMLGIRVARASYLAYSGFATEALSAVEDVERDAARLGGTAFRTSIDPAAVWALALAGRWSDALERAQTATEEFERSGELFLLAVLRTAEADILVERGDVGRARQLLQTLSDAPAARPPAARVQAAVDLALGRVDAARAGLRAAVASSERTGRLQLLQHLRERLITVELEAGDQQAADEELDRLLSDTGAAADRSTPWSVCVTERAIARVRGDADAARRAQAAAEGAGIVFEAAVSELLAGQLAADGECLRHAYDVFAELGADPWKRRAATSLREAGLGVPGRRSEARGGLTETERHLARLVTDGLTNREIARAMHLSPKTIEVYLSRLYVKAGCTSRVGLAVAVKEGALALD